MQHDYYQLVTNDLLLLHSNKIESLEFCPIDCEAVRRLLLVQLGSIEAELLRRKVTGGFVPTANSLLKAAS